MKKYIDYVKKCNEMLKQASKRCGISVPSLWLDYIWCVIRHRTLIKQYVYSEYWTLSESVRRAGLTYSRLVSLMDSHTDKSKVCLLRDKWIFNEYFKEFVSRDWLYVKDSTFEEFKAFCEKHDCLFIKPADSQEGKGIRLYKQSENSEVKLYDLFLALRAEATMVEECIRQNSKMCFGTRSVNTIKVTTVADSNDNVKVLKAMLRVGVGDSIMDNLSAGGAIYDIDIDGGFVSSYGYGKHGEKHVYHPGSKNVLLGFEIPNWDKVIKCAIDAHKKIASIKIIGWDVAVTEKGVELIEGNHNPDYLPIEYGTRGFYVKMKNALK